MRDWGDAGSGESCMGLPWRGCEVEGEWWEFEAGRGAFLYSG